ncbi:MAG: hypothetical protein WCI71_01735 [Bacteroidota bacterium]
MSQEVLITMVVFFAIYQLIKMFTDFLLKRKIIKAGHLDHAGILEPVKQDQEENRFPTLKWGLVALMSGIGMIVIELLSWGDTFKWVKDFRSVMPVGIELVFIASGFLIYFFIVNGRKRP